MVSKPMAMPRAIGTSRPAQPNRVLLQLYFSAVVFVTVIQKFNYTQLVLVNTKDMSIHINIFCV